MLKLLPSKITAAIIGAYGAAKANVIEPLRKRIGNSRTANRMHKALFAGMLSMGMVCAMADYNVWSNANIDIQTNPTAAAQVISGITKANPAVVTYVGADPVSGTYIKITGVVGMVEVVGGSNTLELEDIDSTAFGTFVSGNMTPIEFGVSMTTVQDVNSGGGEFQFTDITTIHDALQKRIPTVSSPFTMGLGCLFKPSDAAHIELGKANRTKTTRAIRVRWATGDEAAWLAYVGASGIPTGSAQQVVKTTVSFEGQGTPNFYPA
jgi:Phage tail tube protein, TTP